MASAFYPRGGSAQVVRYLARALAELGHSTLIVSGSLKTSEPTTDAATFFGDLPLVEADYTEAARAFDAGLDPMSAPLRVPFQPSYEDKPGVPDRAFYRVSRDEMNHLVASWREVLSRVVSEYQPDIMHMHHLNHLHLAAMGLHNLDRVPKVAHLHGTELKMVEQMRGLRDGPGLEVGLWEGELRRAAAAMQHLVSVTSDVERVVKLLDIEEDKISFIPNGVDVHLFRPRHWSSRRKLSHLEELLVRSPRGWDESGRPGSVRYDRTRLGAFLDDAGGLKPILLFAGRFLGFKRLPLLMEAVARANRLLGGPGERAAPFNLLVCGGVPGEWEGEHPHAAAKRLKLNNVFLCGWLSHGELADTLNLADVFVAPSYYEPFGQVYLEAMATGLPVIATRSGGPLSFVVGKGEKANGWLSDVDDSESLAASIAESVSNESERMRRGGNALDMVSASYTWSSIAKRFEEIYRKLLTAKTEPAGNLWPHAPGRLS